MNKRTKSPISQHADAGVIKIITYKNKMKIMKLPLVHCTSFKDE